MERFNHLIEKERELEDKLDNYIEDTQDYSNICDKLDEVRDELIGLGF